MITASLWCFSKVLGGGGSWSCRGHLGGYCGHSLGGRREDQIGSRGTGVRLQPVSTRFRSCDFIVMCRSGSPSSPGAPSWPGGVLQHKPVAPCLQGLAGAFSPTVCSQPEAGDATDRLIALLSVHGERQWERPQLSPSWC